MKYWVFQSNQVTGPYSPDDLTQVPGYSGETLVCPEGRRGTNMGDWQRASMVPELSFSIIKAGQLAVALKGSGGYGGLPPEPTLKDLAALGSLQEKVSLLDNTVSHLQESLRLKEEELLSVHKELDDKAKYAQELSVKLGGLEERFTAVNQLREGLDKAVEAEHDVESSVEKQARLIEDLSTQLKSLREEQRQMEELKEELSRVKEQQQKAQEETEKKLAEARAAAEEADRKAADAAAKAAEAASKPAAALAPAPGLAPLGGPAAGAPVALGAASGGLKPELSPAERLGLPSERPTPLSADAPAPLSPLGGSVPLTPLGDSAPLSPLGEVKPPQPLGGVVSAEPLGSSGIPPVPAFPGAPGEAPLAGVAAAAAGDKLAPVVPEPAAAAPAKKKPLALVAVAVIAVGALGAVKMGLVGGKKKAAPPPVADQTPLPPPAPVEAPKPPAPSPEELAEQEKQQAIALVRGWALPDMSTVGAKLDSQSPVTGGLSPWMADGKDGRYQVNFYAPKTDKMPALAYEFDVSLADHKIAAHNQNAEALLAGKPIEAEKPKRVAKAHNPRKPKIRPKHALPKAQDSGLLEDLLTVDDKPADAKKKPAAKADAGDGSGDTLVDGEGHSAEPQQIAAKPMRKAPKRAEKRDVDKELNDLLGDAPEKPAPKAAAPKDQSLDDLLAPGSARPGDAAPSAEPSAADDSGAAADKGAEPMTPPSGDASGDASSAPDSQDSQDTAEAPAPKAAAKARKKGGQAADAELLDDLLKP